MKKIRNFVAGLFGLVTIFIATMTPFTNVWWIALLVFQGCGFVLAYIVFIHKKMVRYVMPNLRKKKWKFPRDKHYTPKAANHVFKEQIENFGDSRN